MKGADTFLTVCACTLLPGYSSSRLFTFVLFTLIVFAIWKTSRLSNPWSPLTWLLQLKGSWLIVSLLSSRLILKKSARTYSQFWQELQNWLFALLTRLNSSVTTASTPTFHSMVNRRPTCWKERLSATSTTRRLNLVGTGVRRTQLLEGTHTVTNMTITSSSE